jgi:hypothetical protein
LGATASGLGSVAIGTNSTASERYSVAIGVESISSSIAGTALGYHCTASGEHSNVAMGEYAHATGYAAIAGGFWSVAIGRSATAFGNTAIAEGNESFAVGFHTYAPGNQSQAFGDGTIASAYGSTAFGWNTRTNGTFSFALGENSTAQARSSLVLGQYNIISGAVDSWITTDPAFVIGNGSSDVSRSNAFTILKNGNTGIGVSNPAYKVDVDGEITSRNSSSGISFRLRNSDYSTLIYHDVNDFYLLTTNLDDPDGIWNNFRPFKINYSTGNVYLGCNDSGSTYSMTARSDGDIYMPRIVSSTSGSGAGVTFLTINSSGKLIKYSITSSSRYKNNIMEMEDVDWLYNLRPVNFTYKNDISGHKEYGLIAEEVEKINPSLVAYGEKGEIESVSYISIISPLVKAVQNQHALIESQNKKIERLEKLVEKLMEEK